MIRSSTVIHSYPRFSTVHQGGDARSPHHTTTVVPVGCGECVVETVEAVTIGVIGPHTSTVHSSEAPS